MLTFRTVLESEKLDPSTVRLVRHQGIGVQRLTPWGLWLADDGRFDLYQRIQKRPKFDGAAYVASFVATQGPRTLFVGLYQVSGRDIAPPDMSCPLMGHSVGGLHLYNLSRCETLNAYIGRLCVDWGRGYIAWVQRADGLDKPITELLPTKDDPPFPGFVKFKWNLSEIEALPRPWRDVLSNSRGVYLLVCTQTGVQYVGSATGEDGLLGRWRDYAANGHGGNVRMIGRDVTDYSVTILEVSSSTATAEEILAREQLWIAKLGSRAHGLN